MILSIVVVAVTCLLMIVGVLFFPRIRIGRIKIDTYWVATLIGAAVILACGAVDIHTLGEAFLSNSAINPLKILVLFLSMTVLSVFLDELGFFGYLASKALKHAVTGQKRLFFILYITVSALTVFTSNDVIILSFTPFICYFAKNAKINPMPYLAAEFVAANTWSMLFIIGNPTNIYLATSYGLDFVSYLKTAVIPTILAGGTALAMLYLVYRKKLSAPIESAHEDYKIDDRPLLTIGVIHLVVCTVLLAVSSYIKGLEMWIVSLSSVASLFLFSLIICLMRKFTPQNRNFCGDPGNKHQSGFSAIKGCLKRAPYPLIPFLISMFILVEALAENGVTHSIGLVLGSRYSILTYGATSFLSANLINNIPMSVLFAKIAADANAGLYAVFAAIIGSNLGALLTPIGALAGIMWSNLLNDHGYKFSYKDFLKMGVMIALPTLCAALGGLYLITVF